ncbi:MAG: ComF family protein [Eggerthellaceae bacterium]|nr:ComF family protein [Eggerthellaceae bacterium]
MGFTKSDIWQRGTQVAKAYFDASAITVLETLWPSRCVICEAPGDLVCERCRLGLSYIDQWLACPRCGAPYGVIECTECNELSLKDAGRDRLPFDACVSVALFNRDCARIVTCHKDGGERGLADFMGHGIACAIPPEWLTPTACVVPLPATAKARRRRGFDHGVSIGQHAAGYLGVECIEALQAGRARDQRALTRNERFRNMDGRFKASSRCQGDDVILIDDVYTTGASLCAATDALLTAGARSVRCATFARVY